MAETKSAVEIFECVLERARTKKLPLISLRPKEISEMVSYEGDYDYYLPPAYMNELFQIVFDLAVEEKTSFTVNRYKHGKAVVVLHNRSDNRSIFLEIWNMLSVKDPYKKTIRYIYPDQLANHIVFDANDVASFSLDIEALYYLSHLYTGGKKISTPLVGYRISYYEAALSQIGSVYAKWYQQLAEGTIDIKRAAHLANMELVEKEVLFLRHFVPVIQETKTKLASSLNRLKRQWLRRLNTIPVVGPDGVGKTTFIEAVLKKTTHKAGYFRFKKLFRSSPLYRIAFPILQRVLKKEVNDKFIGKTEVDDRYASIVFVNALLMFPFRLISTVLTGRLMLVDRYFHDYLLTNIRLNTGKAGLRANWKMLLHWIPQQYWFIHLDASTEIILSRKGELNADGIASYRNDIFKAYLEKPFMIYTYLNTEATSEQCSDLIATVADTVADIEL